MNLKEKIDRIIMETGASREYREALPDGELIVADAFSPFPHSNFARFVKRAGVCDDMAREYPFGCWVTMWWIVRPEIQIPMGICLFEPFKQENKDVDSRVNAALDKAVPALNEIRHARIH